MLDHVGFAVSDYERSKAFYEHALAPLGLTLIVEPAGQAAGFGTAGSPWPLTAAVRSTRSTPLHSTPAESTMAHPAFVPSTTPTTTGLTCSILTATTSRLSATSRHSAGARAAPT